LVYMASRIGTKLFSMELGKTFIMVNMYGPNEDGVLFWEDVIGQNCLKAKNLNNGRHLNLTIISTEK